MTNRSIHSGEETKIFRGTGMQRNVQIGPTKFNAIGPEVSLLSEDRPAPVSFSRKISAGQMVCVHISIRPSVIQEGTPWKEFIDDQTTKRKILRIDLQTASNIVFGRFDGSVASSESIIIITDPNKVADLIIRSIEYYRGELSKLLESNAHPTIRFPRIRNAIAIISSLLSTTLGLETTTKAQLKLNALADAISNIKQFCFGITHDKETTLFSGGHIQPTHAVVFPLNYRYIPHVAGTLLIDTSSFDITPFTEKSIRKAPPTKPNTYYLGYQAGFELTSIGPMDGSL